MQPGIITGDEVKYALSVETLLSLCGLLDLSFIHFVTSSCFLIFYTFCWFVMYLCACIEYFFCM